MNPGKDVTKRQKKIDFIIATDTYSRASWLDLNQTGAEGPERVLDHDPIIASFKIYEKEEKEGRVGGREEGEEEGGIKEQEKEEGGEEEEKKKKEKEKKLKKKNKEEEKKKEKKEKKKNVDLSI